MTRRLTEIFIVGGAFLLASALCYESIPWVPAVLLGAYGVYTVELTMEHLTRQT